MINTDIDGKFYFKNPRLLNWSVFADLIFWRWTILPVQLLRIWFIAVTDNNNSYISTFWERLNIFSQAERNPVNFFSLTRNSKVNYFYFFM